MTSEAALLRASPIALVERASGFTLSPMQRAFVLAASGVHVEQMPPEVRDMAEVALGYDRGPSKPPRVVFLNKGARGGGTMLASYLAALRALTCDLSGLAPGESARVAHLSVSMQQARHGLRYALGCIRGLGLGSLITSERRDSFTLKRGKHEVEFIVLRSNTSGDDVAGYWYCGVVIHEASLAADPSSGGVPVDLTSIERAARPRLLPARGAHPGGLFVYETTSRDATGQAFDLFHDSWARPDARVLAFKATTLQLRPDDEELAEHVHEELAADHANARREFFCEWSSLGQSGRVFDDESITPCLTSESTNLAPDTTLQAFAACDLAFSNDGSALAIVRQTREKQLELCSLKRWRPTKGAPLQPSVVINELLDECARHGVQFLWSDVHHMEQLRELAAKRRSIRVRPAPAGQHGKYQAHANAQEIMASGTFTMGRDHLLVRSLKSIMAVRDAGGGLRIRTPRRRGNHGDDASALVLALHAAHVTVGKGRDPKPRRGQVSRAMRALGMIDADGRPRGEQSFAVVGGIVRAVPRRRGSQFSGSKFSSGGF